MLNYTVTRTEQNPITFHGEKIAAVYGEWANGLLWLQYHNLIVYRTEDNRYVLSIQYRTGCATIDEIEQPHDYAVMVGDINALTEELRRYDPLAYRLHRPLNGEDDNYIRQRYRENVKELLNFVKRVEGGEAPPLRNEVIIEWGEIDDDVRAVLAADGAPEGISGHEVLRRSVERQMEAEGEGGATVAVIGTETRDDEEDPSTAVIHTVAAPIDSCVECGAKRPDVFFTSWELGYSLCQACYEARQTRDEGVQ
jgi:hypothetical protein